MSSWNRMHFTVSHHDDIAYCATAQATERGEASYKNTTYGAAEGEEGLDELVLGEEGMPCHQVDESAESTSPPLNEFALRDGGQDCGQIPEKTKIYGITSVKK